MLSQELIWPPERMVGSIAIALHFAARSVINLTIPSIKQYSLDHLFKAPGTLLGESLEYV